MKSVSVFNNRATGHRPARNRAIANLATGTRATGSRATGKRQHAGTIRTLLCAALCATSSLASAESLYNEATFQSLTADRRALRAGDSLTVLVIENASASASANTTTNKTGGISGSIKGSASHGGTINLADYSAAATL